MLGCTKLFFGKANLRQSGKKLEVIIRSFHVFNIIINKEKTSTKLLKGDLSSCLNNIYSTNLSALLTKCCSDAGPLQFFAIYGEIAEITIFAGYPSTSFNPWICNFSNFSQFFAAACIHGHISSCKRNEPYYVNSHARQLRNFFQLSFSEFDVNVF